ncbi:MAG: ferredoxin family protein [Alphaproteobacteria bacterium]|jgi:NAD-dependent dihydropyrimidine dehydrogenase PreA subunit|nr:ferredoxin family protein [Alphaproteobacteria bacterium]
MSAAPQAEDCKQPPKVVVPVINAHRCEGAGDCEEVCPYDVFQLRKLTKPEMKALPFGPWLKVLAHGGKQAFVVNGDACHACGLCVAACPEKAIRLIRGAA